MSSADTALSGLKQLHLHVDGSGKHTKSQNSTPAPANVIGFPFHLEPASSDDGDLRTPEAQPNHSHNNALSQHQTYYKSPPDTPATRTGPPRSLSFAYSFTNSPSRHNSGHQYDSSDLDPSFSYDIDELNSFSRSSADFRDALEFPSSQHILRDRKGKRRESQSVDDGWILKPIRWFQESQRDEHPHSAGPVRTQEPEGIPEDGEVREEGSTKSGALQGGDTPLDVTASGSPKSEAANGESSVPNRRSGVRRAFSLPHSHSENKAGKDKWAKLRSLLPNLVHDQGNPILPGPSAVTSQAVNITDELITGGLSTLMLRLWFERDEKGYRRVPILLHRLRIRISDSYHPTEEKKTAFRIECEYANGAARWVVYRQLRDFFSLHTHYTVSNVYNRLGDRLPEFPLTSIPYLKFLKKEDGHIDQASFARLQRENLEDYLIKLIRAVMFHPSSNRLSGFLEISALSITLAQSGGTQYKAGYLQIQVMNNGGGGFGRKGLGRKAKSESHWCAVRESYLVVLEEPGELTVWDVFLFDPEFKIERPKRYYRQGLNTILGQELVSVVEHPFLSRAKPSSENPVLQESHLTPHNQTRDCDGSSFKGTIKSIKSRVSKIFHLDSTHDQPAPANIVDTNNDSDSFSSSIPPPHQTAILDPSTNTNAALATSNGNGLRRENVAGQPSKKKDEKSDVSKHTFYISNSQMKLKLFAKSKRQMLQWITALERSASASHYMGKNRFDSFSPIRLNVAAQWLVDGRDYFWNLSRAILLAREVIYIHDWWLSPELLMRRPGKDRYRLDRLLERKAKEGVKIYVILYQEVSNRTTPTDSNYAKQRLMGTFYWAHHEKLCVIDQAIAFMGGLDLCFGRWDTAQHALTDDVDGTDHPEIWPGKDYSNPRVSDFHSLHKPDEDMYDRTKNPRMPWHDVAMQVVGQPARDFSRHFVQRWNYLLRIKNHTRVMPFLLPPPEFKPGELAHMGLTGTCEMQVCRSSGPWSMGTPTKIEHSIQNAYLKAIQMSEHFVYIENQFFITSTTVDDVKIENNIGDAIVHRIIKAYKDGTPWKCCVVIPLLPGFTFPVDHSDASAIRIILECQNRTIARGPNSIFSRLKKEGIDPTEYITIFSLRTWGKLRGDILTTEQVYIHGKICIVDDRLAIIGSANINERSQRGDRDSELAAVIRDTDMIDGTMAGRPFKVGRFAHSLRVRLMREHLGINVDALEEEDLMTNEPVQPENEQQAWDPDQEQQYGQDGVTTFATAGLDGVKQAGTAIVHASVSAEAQPLQKVRSAHDIVATENGALQDEQKDLAEGKEETGSFSSTVLTAEEKTIRDDRPSSPQAEKRSLVREGDLDNQQDMQTPTIGEYSFSFETDEQSTMVSGEKTSAPTTTSNSRKGDIPRRFASRNSTKWTVPTTRPQVDADNFEDPISDSFWKDIWVASAAYNTEIYRKVFHAIPDDTISTWKQYKEFVAHHERMNKPLPETSEPVARVPSEPGDEGAPGQEGSSILAQTDESEAMTKGESSEQGHSAQGPANTNGTSERSRKPAKGTEPFEKWERDKMEKLLKELNGHLVIYPNHFLEGEDVANNFLFNADRLLPIPIYN